MKNIILLNSSVKELSLVNKLPSVPSKLSNFELQIRFEYNVNFGEDNEHAIAHLKQFVEATNNPHIFSLSVSCDGFLQTDTFESTEDKKTVHVQGYYLLFPIVSALINHIVVSAGLPALVLPPVIIDESSITIQ